MAALVIMPRQGQSVESCIISKWHKKKGDKVNIGELLFSYETDKASFDEEARVTGTLLDTFFQEGDDVPCLINVCVIGEEGEDAQIFSPKSENADKREEVNIEQQQSRISKEDEAAIHTQVIPEDNGRLKISPRARNLAEKTGVDFRNANPSGPNGRIVEKDIRELSRSGHVLTPSAMEAASKAAKDLNVQGTGIGGRITSSDLNTAGYVHSEEMAEYSVQKPIFEEVKLTNIRKVIAKAMHNSISSTAQLTLHTSFDASDILSFRKKIKEGKDNFGLENITINDIILYAVSRTLAGHKDLNAHFLEDRMLYFKNVNLGLAVDTERGLMVPTVFDANLKSLNDISKEVKKLVKNCQTGTISPDLLKGGTFTVTNLGTLDIECFTPILNPPQTGILGVNNIIQRAKEVDGEYIFYPAIGLSLTFDHRALDGAPAAKFLQDLKKNLENFSVMLVK